jgi:hypothetical protein
MQEFLFMFDVLVGIKLKTRELNDSQKLGSNVDTNESSQAVVFSSIKKQI